MTEHSIVTAAELDEIGAKRKLRCPACRRGYLVEDTLGEHCSRWLAPRKPCAFIRPLWLPGMTR